MSDLGTESKNKLELFNSYYSLEAEQSVLGAVLIDSTCLDKIAEIILNPDYFYVSSHKIIYTVILELFVSGEPIDYVTLLERLKQEKNFEEVNYKSYLLQIAQIVPSVNNIEYYAEIIRDKYNLRVLVNTAREIIDNASETDVNPSDLLNLAEQKIFDIRRGKETKGLQRINEIILQTFDRLDEINSRPEYEYSGIRAVHFDSDICTFNILFGMACGRTREGFGDGVHQGVYAPHLRSGAAVNGRDRTGDDALVQSEHSLVTRDLLAGEVLLHELLARAGKSLVERFLIRCGEVFPLVAHHELLTLALFVVAVCLHGDEVDHDNVLIGTDRHENGAQRCTEHFVQIVEDAVEVCIGIVALID